jgi:pimeloyl-ACP methyl ester carboxylesterase
MFLRDGAVPLRTVAFGPGPKTVLALNGWSATWEAWQPTFEVLSQSMRCVSYDTRGTGSSVAPASAISVDGLVDDVFRVLDAHRVERCVLAGESLGGFVAMNAALRDPKRFTGLVLVGTPMLITPATSGKLIAGARANYRATISKFVQLCLSEPGSEHLHPWGEKLFLDAEPETAARLLECCHPVTPDFASIAVPTVLVHGEKDLVVPVEFARLLAQSIPGAKLVELPGGGHVPTITAPDRVAEAIRSVA